MNETKSKSENHSKRGLKGPKNTWPSKRFSNIKKLCHKKITTERSVPRLIELKNEFPDLAQQSGFDTFCKTLIEKHNNWINKFPNVDDFVSEFHVKNHSIPPFKTIQTTFPEFSNDPLFKSYCRFLLKMETSKITPPELPKLISHTPSPPCPSPVKSPSDPAPDQATPQLDRPEIKNFSTLNLYMQTLEQDEILKMINYNKAVKRRAQRGDENAIKFIKDATLLPLYLRNLNKEQLIEYVMSYNCIDCYDKL